MSFLHPRVIGVAAATVLALSSATLFAQAPAYTQPAPSIPAGNVDLIASRVYTFVGKSGLGHEHAIEGRLSYGNVRLGAMQNAGQLVFDMTTFDADTTAARKYLGLAGTTDDSTRRQVNANMQGAAVLDVARFPTATYQIDSAQLAAQRSQAGNPLYVLQGQFTLHGTTQPLKMAVEAIPVQGAVRLRGGFPMKQTQYGMTPFSKGFGLIGVSDELKIYGDLVLRATPPVGAPRR